MRLGTQTFNALIHHTPTCCGVVLTGVRFVWHGIFPKGGSSDLVLSTSITFGFYQVSYSNHARVRGCSRIYCSTENQSKFAEESHSQLDRRNDWASWYYNAAGHKRVPLVIISRRSQQLVFFCTVLGNNFHGTFFCFREKLKGLAIGASNAFALVTGALLLGFGLVEVPRGLWKHADPVERAKWLSHKVSKVAEKLDDAHQELSTVLVVCRWPNQRTFSFWEVD